MEIEESDGTIPLNNLMLKVENEIPDFLKENPSPESFSILDERLGDVRVL